MRHLIALIVLVGCNEYDLQAEKIDEQTPEDSDIPMIPLDQPDIEVSPGVIDFGFLPKDCPTDLVTVDISNVGEADLEISDILLDGDVNFRIHDEEIVVLAPGENTWFQLDFMATSNSAYSGSVTIASNDPDEAEVTVELVGTGADDEVIEEIFEQGIAASSDILWVVDSSESMAGEVKKLNNNFSIFINGFVALGLDYQIAVVTTDMDDPDHQGKFVGPIITPSTVDPVGEFTSQTDVGTGGSVNEMPLDAAHAALSSPLITNENAGFLRTDSVVTIIVVTDEDDVSSINAADMVDFIDNLQGDPTLTSFNIVAGPEMQSLLTFPCGLLGPMGTVKLPKVVKGTGGFHFDLCQQNWATSLAVLANTAAGLDISFPLTQVPDDLSSVEVWVDGVAISYSQTDGAYYDSTTNSVVFAGTAIPDAEAEIVVHYTVETECPSP
jgi:hypothetical protein